ncbi:MAG: response regulator [Myxococcaceae bacterium]
MITPLDYKQYTVLFVDDERTNRSVLQLALSEIFDFHVAESGEEALLVAADHQIAVLVTDQRMPGMSGLELAKKFRELFPATQRVIITGFTQTSELLRAVDDGMAAAVLAKPVMADALAAVIKKLIGRVRG